MSYASVEDLQSRLGPIYANIYAFETEANDDLADAQAEIDGCLSKRYRVPVSAPSVQALLKGWTLTLCEERSYARGGAGSLAENVVSRVAQVRKYLEMAMKGEFQLPGAAEQGDGDDNGGEGGSGMALFESEEPQFTREKLEGY